MEEILSKPIRNKPENCYFDWIKDGSKTYEGRLKCKCKKSEWNLYIGKKIHFYDEDNPADGLLVEVIELPIFKNFGEAFDVFGSNLIPDRSKREVINMYNELFHYEDEILYGGITSKMIDKEGVVAIGFKIIS
jgi:ASC-1-like (ASCH) protein